MFFKAVRAGLAVKHPNLSHTGRASNAEKQRTGPGIRAKVANWQQTPKRQRVTNWFGGAEPGLKIRTSVVCSKYRTIVHPWKFFLSYWLSVYYR